MTRPPPRCAVCGARLPGPAWWHALVRLVQPGPRVCRNLTACLMRRQAQTEWWDG